MRQVFLNLFMNAGHAIGSGGIIGLRTRVLPDSGMIEAVVEDNGPGIDEEIINKIFDPFFTTKSQGAGTGLGLSVSYGIIRDHDGDIRVETGPAGTTRFIITLPSVPGREV
jgi:signal transduction histidine kinase